MAIMTEAPIRRWSVGSVARSAMLWKYLSPMARGELLGAIQGYERSQDAQHQVQEYGRGEHE